MRALAACLLLVTPLLSGCTLDQIRGLEPDAPQPVTLAWGLSDCTFVVAVVPIPASRLEGRLPPGFTPLTPAEIGLPADPRGNANVGIEAWACNAGLGVNGTLPEEVTPLAYGAVFSFVTPPKELAVEGSTYHFVKWDVLVPDHDRRVLMESHGVPAKNGSVTFAQYRAAGPQTLFDASLDLNGTFVFRGGAAAPRTDLQAFSFTEFTQTQYGLATWNTNVTAGSVSGGTGSLAIPEGAVRDIVGAASTQAYYLTGTGGAFANGTITLPPRPLE